ncbi:DUF7344 domain-containing protein [Haladaptatus sp. NG-SE-30]
MTRFTGTEQSGGHPPSPSLDTCLDLLADQWRRHLLYYFADSASVTATIDELVTYLIQQDTTAATADETEVTIRLMHNDLPKLAESDVIEWNQDHNVVRKGPTFEELQPLLELIDKHRDERSDGWM